MSNGTRIARNTVFLMGSRIFMAAATLLLMAKVGRELGVESFGVFTLALTYSRIFYVVADFGAGFLTVREVARNHDAAGNVLASGSLIKLGTVLPGLLVVYLVTQWLYTDTSILPILMLGVLSAIFQGWANFFRSFFNAIERMALPSILMAAEAGTALVACTFVMSKGYDVLGVMATYCAVYAVSAVVSAVLLVFILKLRPVYNHQFTRRFFRDSLPFISFSVFGILYAQVDTVLLSVLSPDKTISVGIYQATLKLIMALDYFPDMLTRSVYPAISRTYKLDLQQSVLLSERTLRLLTLLGLPIAVGLFVLADPILHLVYGTDFAGAAVVMQILALVIPLRYISYIYGISLSATDNQKYRAYTTALVFFVNFLLNLVVIPRYSYVGSAYLNLLSTTIVCALYYHFSKRHYANLHLRSYLLPAAFSSMLMGVFLWGLGLLSLPWYLLVIFGALLYFSLLVVTRAVNRNDFSLVTNMFGGMARPA